MCSLSGGPSIQHQLIVAADARPAAAPRVHVYRSSPPWAVAALALVAALAVLLLSAGFASAVTPPPAEAVATRAPASARPVGAHAARPAAPAARPEPAPRGAWQVQVGAFQSRAGAEAHLAALAGRLPELSALEARLERSGPVTRARIGGIVSEQAARALCAGIAARGSACFVVAAAQTTAG